MFAIVRSAIDVAALSQQAAGDSCGAVVTFAGVVRDRSDEGRPVLGLSYEAHEEMAIAEFEQIALEARERFGASSVAVVHRIGDLNVGETAVAVAVSSQHRAEAFDACEYVIDELKARAPIWKRERYSDGTSEWRENDCRSAPSPS